VIKELVLALGCALPLVGAAQTLTLNDAATAVAKPMRIGVNMGNCENYDNGQILKTLNACGGNPGFEPIVVRQIQALTAAGTRKSFTDYDKYSLFAPDILAGSTFTIVESASAGAELGCTGTIASHTGPNLAHITSGAVTSGIATLTAMNNFASGSSVTLRNIGAALSAFNGQTVKISRATPSTFSFRTTNDATVETTALNAYAQTDSAYAPPVYTIDPRTNQGSSGCAAAFAAGDQVEMTLAEPSTSEAEWESGYMPGVNGPNLANGAQLLSDTSDLCATCGSQALEVNLPATNSAASFYNAWDSLDANVWVLMNGVFQVSVWAKAASGAPSLTAQLSRGSRNGISCPAHRLTVTSNWANYTWTCIGNEVGIASGNARCVAGGTTTACTQPGLVKLQINVTNRSSGASSLYLDNLTVTNARDTTASTLRGPVLAHMAQFHPGTYRYWLSNQACQNGETLDNWIEPMYAVRPTGVTNGSGLWNLGAQYCPTLEEYLVQAQTIGATPYVEVPVSFSAAEAANLVEFLASPSTTIYGAKRAALGQTLPWTSIFPTMYLSFCNECWNTGFSYQSLGGRSGQPNSEVYYDYSTRARDIFAAMRADAYYSPSLQLGMNVQTAIDYSADAAAARSHPDYIEFEGYLGSTAGSDGDDKDRWGWLAPDIWLQLHGPGARDKKNTHNSFARYNKLAVCGASGKATCYGTHYEWGQGTLTSPSQTAQDALNAGAGTGVLDALQPLLTMQSYPTVGPQDFFAWNGYSNGAQGGHTGKIWGMVIDDGGATNNVRPSFLAMSLVNAAIIGPMYPCTLDASNLTSYAGNANNGEIIPPGTLAISGIPKVFSFCFRNGSNRAVVLVNTDLSHPHTIVFAGTNPPAGSVSVVTYAPVSPNQLNEAGTGTATYLTAATTSLSNTTVTDPASATLPPYSVVTLAYTVGAAGVSEHTADSPKPASQAKRR